MVRLTEVCVFICLFLLQILRVDNGYRRQLRIKNCRTITVISVEGQANRADEHYSYLCVRLSSRLGTTNENFPNWRLVD